MDTISRAANGYAFDFLGGTDNDWYLWDFGVFTAVGPKERPIQATQEFNKYQALLRDSTDAADIETREPDATTTVDFFEYDYSMFMLVPLGNATHVINPETEVPIKISDDIEINGESGVLLQSEDRRDTSKDAITTTELEDRIRDGWEPAIRLLN